MTRTKLSPGSYVNRYGAELFNADAAKQDLLAAKMRHAFMAGEETMQVAPCIASAARHQCHLIGMDLVEPIRSGTSARQGDCAIETTTAVDVRPSKDLFESFVHQVGFMLNRVSTKVDNMAVQLILDCGKDDTYHQEPECLTEAIGRSRVKKWTIVTGLIGARRLARLFELKYDSRGFKFTSPDGHEFDVIVIRSPRSNLFLFPSLAIGFDFAGQMTSEWTTEHTQLVFIGRLMCWYDKTLITQSRRIRFHTGG